MKADISNVMGKLTGAELGRLFIKDEIGIMAGIARTYSRDDFDMATNKMERADVLKYLNYWHLSKELIIMCLNHWFLQTKLSEYVARLNALCFYSIWTESHNDTRQILTFERISNHPEDDPGKYEIFYRDSFKRLIEFVESEKEDFNSFQTLINEFIVLYLDSYDLLREASNRFGLPEIEAIAGDMSIVESIIDKINELRGTKLYKDLFQEIDIEELKQKKQLDVKKKVDDLMTWLD